jgi:hypothetical protein
MIYILNHNDMQQQLDESVRIPKATIDILKDQVFGFDTFFVTSQEPYEVTICISWFTTYCVQHIIFITLLVRIPYHLKMFS